METEEPCDEDSAVPTEHVVQKRVIKRIIYINGEPVETEEEIEEPVGLQSENYTFEQNPQVPVIS